MTKTLLSFCGEEDRKKLLNLRPASERPTTLAAVVMAKGVDPAKPVPTPIVDVCEFIRDYAFSGSSGRKCTDGTFCPVSVYGKLAVYQTCPTRSVKLREQRKEQP